MWYLKRFEELTAHELHLIYKARVAVFVVEQACPYQEVDDADQMAWHLFEVLDGQIASYVRLIPEVGGGVRIGRVLVAEAFRGNGKGRDVFSRALEVSKELFMDQPVYIQAQAYLLKFYASFGFEATSEVYLEDNIPHVDMVLQ